MADQSNESNQPNNFQDVFREPAKGTRLGVVVLAPGPCHPSAEEACWEVFPVACSYDPALNALAFEFVHFEVDQDNEPEADLMVEDEELEAIGHWAEQFHGEAILREYETLDDTAIGVIDQLVRFSNGSSTQPLERMKTGVRAHINMALRSGVRRSEVWAILQSFIGVQGTDA